MTKLHVPGKNGSKCKKWRLTSKVTADQYKERDFHCEFIDLRCDIAEDTRAWDEEETEDQGNEQRRNLAKSKLTTCLGSGMEVWWPTPTIQLSPATRRWARSSGWAGPRPTTCAGQDFWRSNRDSSPYSSSFNLPGRVKNGRDGILAFSRLMRFPVWPVGQRCGPR